MEEIKALIRSEVKTAKKHIYQYEEEEFKPIKEQVDLLLKIKTSTRTICNLIEKLEV